MRRLLSLIGLGLVLIAAASPAEAVSDLESEGFYIEPGSNASAEVVGDAIAEAGFAGSRFYVAVLAEEPPSGATFFSDALLDELGDGTILTVAPETVGWASVGDIWSNEQLDEALAASLDGSSDDDVVTLFVGWLTDAPLSPGVDPPDSASGSNGGTGWIWFLVVGGGLFLLFMFLRNRSNATASNARDARLREFYTAAQAKLNDIANDILEMEDEVSLSDNPKVRSHYDSASGTYADLIDKVPKATTADDLVEIAYQLDVAIWELDAAEALLDAKSVPDRPEKPIVERPPARPTVVATPTAPDDFDRRSQRQSSPAGPDLGNILMAILAAQSFGGRRSGTWGQPGSHPPGTGGGFPGGPGGGGGGRMRGGGRRGG